MSDRPTALNPIIEAAATLAAARDWPISGMTYVAPAISGTGCLVINWAKFGAAKPDTDPTPQGVTVQVTERQPEDVIDMPPLTDAQDMVIAAAWWFGAWDIKRTAISHGYDGPLPPYAARMHQAAREQGYVAWYWRPMMRAPEIRARQWRARDKTLNPWTLGRDVAPPAVAVRPARPNTEMVIQLGLDPSAPPGSPARPTPRASVQQRGYLGRLLRDAGQDDTLPLDLTMAEASRQIDQLRPDAGTGRKKVGRNLPSTANQHRVIMSLLHRLRRNEYVPLRITYAEAAEIIEKLKKEL